MRSKSAGIASASGRHSRLSWGLPSLSMVLNAPPSLTFGALLALQAWCVPVLSETTMKKLSHTSPNSWDRVIGLGCAFLLVAGVLFDVFAR